MINFTLFGDGSAAEPMGSCACKGGCTRPTCCTCGSGWPKSEYEVQIGDTTTILTGLKI
jgi:hypothetical protein